MLEFGLLVQNLVVSTLQSSGIDVIDLGLSTTPTVEIAVYGKASGGIILTASHNPKQWNALKLLNEKGEFVSIDDGQILRIAEEENFEYAHIDDRVFEKERHYKAYQCYYRFTFSRR